MNTFNNTESLISIIVPVYNVKLFLSRCLETISKQTYQNLEIIIVDDGSTDGSGAICDDFVNIEKRAIVIHQDNQGLWAARNSGQKVAKGDFIMYVDSDDYLHTDMVKSLYDALILYPECGLSMCNYKRTTSLQEDIYVQETTNSYKIISLEQLLNLGDSVLPDIVWNKLYRRSLVEGIWARNYRIAQDVDFNFRVFMHLESAVMIDRDLYYWMQRSNSAMHQRHYRRSHLKIITDICHRNFIECSEDNDLLRAYFLQRLYSRMLLLRLYSWDTEEKNSSIQHCKNCMRDTRLAYISCHRICAIEKICCLLLLKMHPRITSLLMYIRRKIV